MNWLEPATKAQSVLQLLDLSVLVKVFIEMKITRQTTETGVRRITGQTQFFRGYYYKNTSRRNRSSKVRILTASISIAKSIKRFKGSNPYNKSVINWGHHTLNLID